jgi:SAM-dependent methyltransferase
LQEKTLFRRVSVWVLCVALAQLIAVSAYSAEPDPAGYQPRMGQPGKDVVWIPSPPDMVEKMLDMARVTPSDFVIDLGSGDGRNVIAAARRGARAMGVEYNPDMVELAKRAAAAAAVDDRATFVQGDMFEADISKATVLVLFPERASFRTRTKSAAAGSPMQRSASRFARAGAARISTSFRRRSKAPGSSRTQPSGSSRISRMSMARM